MAPPEKQGNEHFQEKHGTGLNWQRFHNKKIKDKKQGNTQFQEKHGTGFKRHRIFGPNNF